MMCGHVQGQMVFGLSQWMLGHTVTGLRIYRCRKIPSMLFVKSWLHLLKNGTQTMVRVRVAITLYRFGDTAHFRTISNLFGVGKSTVCSIVREVCQAIVDVLLLQYIQLPNTRQQIQEEMDCFKERAGFPQVVGSVDGCHIPILKDYVNRKKFHSIILQALVDSQYLFWDICVGWPGKVHDSRVFKNSPLFTSCCNRSCLPQGLAKVISGQVVPPLIIGDSAYGLQDWLMRPFKDHGHLTREETNFNHALSVTRMVVENAFGRLKGRLQLLWDEKWRVWSAVAERCQHTQLSPWKCCS